MYKLFITLVIASSTFLPLLSQNISIIEVGAYSQIFEKFIEFLGIKAMAPGYSKIKIEPAYIPDLGDCEGYITTPYGKVEVSVKYVDGKLSYTYKAPENIEVI